MLKKLKTYALICLYLGILVYFLFPNKKKPSALKNKSGFAEIAANAKQTSRNIEAKIDELISTGKNGDNKLLFIKSVESINAEFGKLRRQFIAIINHGNYFYYNANATLKKLQTQEARENYAYKIGEDMAVYRTLVDELGAKLADLRAKIRLLNHYANAAKIEHASEKLEEKYQNILELHKSAKNLSGKTQEMLSEPKK